MSVHECSNQQSGTFLKITNALASSAAPKHLENNGRQLKCKFFLWLRKNPLQLLRNSRTHREVDKLLSQDRIKTCLYGSYTPEQEFANKKIPKEFSQFYKNKNPWTDDTNLYQEEKRMEEDVIISVMPHHWCKSWWRQPYGTRTHKPAKQGPNCLLTM